MLIRSENVGPATFHALVQRYGNAKRVVDALPFIAKKGGKRSIRICSKDDALKEWEGWQKKGGGFLFCDDDSYPTLLKKTSDHPPILCYMGQKTLLSQKSFSIVGSRHASLNGLKLAYHFAHALGERGYVIASGLALGIDAQAHEGAMLTGTIAVMAGGADVVYPSSHQNLYERIKETGLILSECPGGTTPQRRMFPRRNRIVSGLSLGVLVVEASLASGSLITARLALEQGRDVFAIPGSPLDERSKGSNKLIKDGAILVETPSDIIPYLEGSTVGSVFDEELLFKEEGVTFVAQNKAEEQEEDEIREKIIQSLSSSPIPLDDIVCVLGCPAALVHGLVAEMEIVGCVQRHSGGRISLVS